MKEKILGNKKIMAAIITVLVIILVEIGRAHV